MNYRTLVWGGLIGFFVGILGNLVAAWIQQDLLRNAFNLTRIVVILGMSLVGIFLAAWREQKQSRMDQSKEVLITTGDAKETELTGIDIMGDSKSSQDKVIIQTKDADKSKITGIKRREK